MGDIFEICLSRGGMSLRQRMLWLLGQDCCWCAGWSDGAFSGFLRRPRHVEDFGEGQRDTVAE
jgi:hypothetical protein